MIPLVPLIKTARIKSDNELSNLIFGITKLFLILEKKLEKGNHALTRHVLKGLSCCLLKQIIKGLIPGWTPAHQAIQKVCDFFHYPSALRNVVAGHARWAWNHHPHKLPWAASYVNAHDQCTYQITTTFFNLKTLIFIRKHFFTSSNQLPDQPFQEKFALTIILLTVST